MCFQKMKPKLEIEPVEQAFGAIGSDELPAYDGGLDFHLPKGSFEIGMQAAFPAYKPAAQKFDG